MTERQRSRAEQARRALADMSAAGQQRATAAEKLRSDISDDELKQSAAAVLKIAAAVAVAIRDLKQVPSGHLYARLQDMMTLNQYEQVISALKRADLIEEKNHLLIWKGKKS